MPPYLVQTAVNVHLGGSCERTRPFPFDLDELDEHIAVQHDVLINAHFQHLNGGFVAVINQVVLNKEFLYACSQ